MNLKKLVKLILTGIICFFMSIYFFYLYLFFTLDNSPFHSGDCPSIETFGDLFMFGFVCRGLMQVIILSGGILAPFAIIFFSGVAIGSVVFTLMNIYKFLFQHSKLTYDDPHIITSIILFGLSICFFYITFGIVTDGVLNNFFIDYIKTLLL